MLNSLVASCQEVNSQLELKRREVLRRRQADRQAGECSADHGSWSAPGVSSCPGPSVPVPCIAPVSDPPSAMPLFSPRPPVIPFKTGALFCLDGVPAN